MSPSLWPGCSKGDSFGFGRLLLRKSCAWEAAFFGEDVNLDGDVKYIGTDNDRDELLLNIGGSIPTVSTSIKSLFSKYRIQT